MAGSRYINTVWVQCKECKDTFSADVFQDYKGKKELSHPRVTQKENKYYHVCGGDIFVSL